MDSLRGKAAASNPLQELKRFKVPYLFPYQRLVVSNILEGCSQLVVLPTGSGKSLCFQLSAYLLPGPTLVVFPLLSLIADQQRYLHGLGLEAGVIRGGQTGKERERLWKGLEQGSIKLVLSNPEALRSAEVLRRIRGFHFSHLVVDEAHCLVEWGTTFRPSYLGLGRMAEYSRIPLITAFTATAAPRVLDQIKRILFGRDSVQLVQGNPDRPNIIYDFVPTLSRTHTMVELTRGAKTPCLIFSRSRTSAEMNARLLRRRLDRSEINFYHAGLSAAERQRIESWFFRSRRGILSATCAYGLGIDKSDIRTVIHSDVPPTVEAYLQETGRGGRDGTLTRAYLVYSYADSCFGKQLRGWEGERFRYLMGIVLDPHHCRRQALLCSFGVEEVVCSGCDVCLGRAATLPEQLATLEDFFRRHKWVFTRREAVRYLAGTPCPGENWTKEDISEAIGSLKAAGLLRMTGPIAHALGGYQVGLLTAGRVKWDWARVMGCSLR